MESLCFFGRHFPKNTQYLVNGESDQKSVTNKRDAKFNFLTGTCYQIQCIFNHYRVITIPKIKLRKLKKPHYLINGDFDQKSAWNKKDVKLNSG